MLNLSGNRLAAVPDISAMHSLRRLDLARNALTEFPVTVCSCAQLVELLLTGNRITNLPRDLEQLGNLEYLEMNECRVGLIDLDFTKLSKLTHLLFSQCRVEEISLLARSTLPALQQLQHLDLVRCRIKDLPPELGQLRYLPLHLPGPFRNSGLITTPSQHSQVSSAICTHLAR